MLVLDEARSSPALAPEALALALTAKPSPHPGPTPNQATSSLDLATDGLLHEGLRGAVRVVDIAGLAAPRPSVFLVGNIMVNRPGRQDSI